jgi:tRNA(adenine34) deaminase
MPPTSARPAQSAAQKQQDEQHMLAIVRFTAGTLETATPVPFGALIVETASREAVMRAVNAVRAENDPSSHAEVRAVRKAAKKLKSPSLKGYTLYTTCEPCPMCMAAAMFSGLDRVVYGTVLETPGATSPPLFPFSAKAFAVSAVFRCQVDGPVEEAACRAVIDDRRPQAYMDRQWKKGVFI